MAITAEARTELITLVVGMFGAAPGANVLDSLTTEIEGGATVTNIATALAGTSLFQGIYPLHLTNAEFATQFIDNVLEEADASVRSDVADLAAGLLNAGTTRAELIVQALTFLSTVDTADAVLGSSAAALANKVDVATYYSVTQNQSGASLAALQSVIATVTSSASTVTAAKDAVDDIASIVLTTGADTYVGSNLNNIVKGIFGDGTATFNTGDSLNGKGGTDKLNLTTTAGGTSAAVAVTNFEEINITDTFGATLDASGILNAPAITFTSTGVTSTVTGASSSSVYGLKGTGDLTVDFASTVGTTTAKLAVTGASAADIDVADGNGIEAVEIATSGTNNVTLTAGTAATSLTITGSGTNTFDLSAADSVADILTLDASTSTGTNTFILTDTLQTTDTITGGTGSDTLSAQFTGATLVKPTLSGIETFKVDFDAAAILNLASTTGLTALSLAGSSADATFTNVASTVTSLTSTTTAGALDINLTYAADTALTTTLGTSAATTYDEINLNGTSALTLNSASTGGVTVTGGVNLDGDQSTITVTATAALDADINVEGSLGDITVTANDDLDMAIEGEGTVGAIALTVGDDVSDVDFLVSGNGSDLDGTGAGVTISVGDNSDVSAGVYVADGGIGDITIDIGEESNFESYFGAYEGGGIGNVTLAAGTHTEAHLGLGVSGGNIGDISFSITGSGASGSFLGAIASAGSIGDITVSLDDGANMYLGISANSVYDEDEIGTEGNVGNISLTLGDDTYMSGFVEASGGSIGNVTVNVEGFEAGVGAGALSAFLTLDASWVSGDTDDDKSADDYVRGGNIGDIALNITGEGAEFYLDATASGGNIGTVTFNVTGEDASGGMFLNALSQGTGGTGGNIGAINLTVGSTAQAGFAVTASDSIGLVTATLADDASAGIFFTSGEGDAAGLVATVGDSSYLEVDVSGFDGEMGDITVTAGDDFSGHFDFASGEGDVGAISVTVGDDAYLDFRVVGYDVGTEFGLITINAADDADIDFNLSGGNDGLELAGINLTLGRDAAVELDFGSGGTFGDLTINAGDDFSGNFGFDEMSGNFGDITVELGDDSTILIDIEDSIGDSIGTATFIGTNSDSSAELTVDATNDFDTIDGVDASNWAGSFDLNLAGVTTGTTIELGAGGSDVIGTDGADNIFLGAGSDTINIDGSSTGVDTLFSFKAGAGNDVLDVENTGNYTAYAADTADTLASGDITVLTDIAGGEDITTAAGLLAALNGGEYDSIDATAGAGTYTFVTAASSAANTFFVFNAVEAADADFDSVTLVGIVNSSTAFSALAAANFA